MSFGSSRVRPSSTSACPCGGGEFGRCCGPILDGAAAPSAERLMRSRYTAYVVGDLTHLVRSWHPRTRPDDLELDGDTVWEGLSIDEADERDDTAVVVFHAAWRRGTERQVMSERSRFVRRGGRWVYVDGDVT
ncbi:MULTISPECIES: YchJ family protein [Microbacterium]|uniref:YchJ family protein n=1 Tax=Microbacterium TaxID=33882 RepID=UPI00278367A1|nr:MULTISPECIES: YchJ family metal-binding protein [Microbacterium]MDQ1077214.1 SEC-C motif-containing protein [Microbacterium sp. SORGH_AS_0969]MDQ1117458.1 SEC-C motif-containing protein [Microbacterium testaceum]